jgi:hypothetical protein
MAAFETSHFKAGLALKLLAHLQINNPHGYLTLIQKKVEYIFLFSKLYFKHIYMCSPIRVKLPASA